MSATREPAGASIKRRIPNAFVAAMAGAVILAADAAGQVPDVTRFTIGVSPVLSQPRADFSQNVGNGFGIRGGVLYHVDRPGVFSLRFDTSWAAYGREKRRVPLSRSIGGRILRDVTTTNSITAFSFGPEVSYPRGKVRPYVNAAIAGLLLRTSSGVALTDDETASTTNYSDLTRAWILGSGVRVPLAGRASNVSLDLGIRYHRGGQASYLREGSIQDQPDGSISFTPLNSRTSHMVYIFGVRFRIPFNSTGPCPRFLC